MRHSARDYLLTVTPRTALSGRDPSGLGRRAEIVSFAFPGRDRRDWITGPRP